MTELTYREREQIRKAKKAAAIIVAATIFEFCLLRWAVATTPLEMGFVETGQVSLLLTILCLWYFLTNQL